MNSKTFKEFADFGLDNAKKPKQSQDIDENPIKNLNLEYVINDLRRQKLGVKESVNNNFFGDIQWGVDSGAVRLSFGPYRGLRAIIHKQGINLLGEHIWLCKEVFEVKNLFDHKPERLITDLTSRLQKVDIQDVEAPSASWDDMERFIIKLAECLKRNNTERVLMFEGIKRLRKNEHYIIHFGCTGNGVQRQGQKRLDQFQVDVKFQKDEGLVKITGQELGDHISQHRWIIDPSQFCEKFSVYQPEQEIFDAVLHLLNSY